MFWLHLSTFQKVEQNKFLKVCYLAPPFIKVEKGGKRWNVHCMTQIGLFSVVTGGV
jgi:hypothetical protein